MKRGRPVLPGTVTQVHLTLILRTGRDDDLLQFFGSLPARRRVAAVKSALRAGGMVLSTSTETGDAELDEDFSDLVFG